MRKKLCILSIVVSLVYFMAVNVNMSIRLEAKESQLVLENIKALASSEAGINNNPCVKAKGFCFANGIMINEMSIKD